MCISVIVLSLASICLLVFYVLTNDSTWNAIKKKVAKSGFLETGCFVVIDACNWRKMLDDGDRSQKRIALLEAEIRSSVHDTSKEEFLQQRLDAALAAADIARLQMLKWHVSTLNGVEIYIHADTPEAAAVAWQAVRS